MRARLRVEVAADALLDAGLAAFGAWTVVYHVCLIAQIGSGWALGAWGAAIAAGGALVARTGRREASAESCACPAPAGVREATRPWPLLLGAVLALAAAVAFATTRVSYAVVWPLWLGAAGCVLVVTARRRRPRAGAPSAPRPVTRADVLVVGAWIVILAALALVLRDTDGDDVFYVHQAAWIGAHGRFPLHDVLFSDDRLPAVYFPPVSSYEALVGTLGRLTQNSAATLVYLVVAPLGSGLAVLALWRLLRTWRVPSASLALSTAIVFLLCDAQDRRWLGSFFVGRMWQGKVLLLTVALPVLLALVCDYAARPSRRRLALLALGGTAAVGLSSSGMFLAPVLALGALAPVIVRFPRRGLVALAATCAYPVAAAIVSKATGGRTPDQYTAAQMGAAHLAHITLGTGVIAGIAIVAVTLAPAFVPRATAALTSAGLLALVVLLLAPGVPREIFDLTGLGRVLWRLTWPLPVAASVGALAVCLPDGRGGRVGRLAPAHAVCLVLALSGTPLWTHGRHAIAAGPVLKRAPADLAAARVALAVARPGDVILASERVSQTVLVLSGEVTTVHPRGFLTWRLNEEPGFAPVARRRLGRFAEGAPPPPAPQLEADLRAVGVDVACLRAARGDDIRALADAGFTVATHAKGLACLRSLRVASGR